MITEALLKGTATQGRLHGKGDRPATTIWDMCAETSVSIGENLEEWRKMLQDYESWSPCSGNKLS